MTSQQETPSKEEETEDVEGAVNQEATDYEGEVEGGDEEQIETAQSAEVEVPSGDSGGTTGNPVDEQGEQPPIEGNVDEQTEEITPAQEKEEKPAAPAETLGEESSEEESNQDGDAPSDDVQKSLSGSCSGLVCGGGLIVSILLTFLFCFCSYRCCCAPRQPKPVLYQTMPEVEMTNGKERAIDFPSYTDDFVDEDDEDDEDGAEYGRKSSFKNV